eukprot:222699_1
MCYPTSRKKYYLQTAIKPQWMDTDLIPDLYKHIVSTGQPPRDIFIPNSERIGYFSVRSKDTAEKLVKSFANNYISSGRKSVAEIIRISQNNYQIKVSNINNIMTSNEFEQWILSLNYNSFDIQLLPSQLIKPSHECILSFDTINSAIFVKQKLQDLQFRGFPLYFTHWHVPRRTQQLSGSNSSQCSGYSTANSTPVSANTGPLYLRDSSVPAPPMRSPPPVPTDSPSITVESATQSATPSHSLKINVNCETDSITLFEPSPVSAVSAERKTSSPVSADVAEKPFEMQKQQLIINDLIKQNRSVQSELHEEKNFGSYMNDKYSELYKNYVVLCRLNRILLWDAENIIRWVVSLDNGWFVKYKSHLEYHLKLQRMNGAMLAKMTQMDLRHIGIVDAKDQFILLDHIHNLFRENREC